MGEVLRMNDVDVEVLQTLTEPELKEMGVDSIGTRRKFVTAMATLASSSSLTSPAPVVADVSIGATLFLAQAAHRMPSSAPTDSGLTGRTQFADTTLPSGTCEPL